MVLQVPPKCCPVAHGWMILCCLLAAASIPCPCLHAALAFLNILQALAGGEGPRATGGGKPPTCCTHPCTHASTSSTSPCATGAPEVTTCRCPAGDPIPPQTRRHHQMFVFELKLIPPETGTADGTMSRSHVSLCATSLSLLAMGGCTWWGMEQHPSAGSLGEAGGWRYPRGPVDPCPVPGAEHPASRAPSPRHPAGLPGPGQSRQGCDVVYNPSPNPMPPSSPGLFVQAWSLTKTSLPGQLRLN